MISGYIQEYVCLCVLWVVSTSQWRYVNKRWCCQGLLRGNDHTKCTVTLWHLFATYLLGATRVVSSLPGSNTFSSTCSTTWCGYRVSTYKNISKNANRCRDDNAKKHQTRNRDGHDRNGGISRMLRYIPTSCSDAMATASLADQVGICHIYSKFTESLERQIQTTVSVTECTE